MKSTSSSSEYVSGTTFSIFSTLVFISLSRILNIFEPVIGTFLISKKAGSWWSFKNILVSFAHSTISAYLSLWCIYKKPEVLFDPISNGSLLNFYVICFSQGYFLYDLLDVFANRSYYKQTTEIVIHHLFILTNVALALYSRTFYGFIIVGLVTENHNILLHFRSLLKQVGIHAEKSRLYKLIALSNLMALTLFRFLPYSYVKYYCFKLYMSDQIPNDMKYCFYSYWFTTCLLLVYSFHLFRRCLRTDFPSLTLRRSHYPTRKEISKQYQEKMLRTTTNKIEHRSSSLILNGNLKSNENGGVKLTDTEEQSLLTNNIKNE